MPTFVVHTPVGVSQLAIRKASKDAVAEATRRGKLRPNYLIAPVRQIRWPAAVAGASIATACWYGARRFLNWFVRHYLSTSLLFGFLGGVIVLILWIFYTAIILLLGGMLADIFDRNRSPQKGRPSPLPHAPSETRGEPFASLPRES